MKIKIRKKQDKKEKEKEVEKQKKTNKTRSILVYILCNKQLKEYRVNATRKFNINDETYVIKANSCYFKKVNGIFEMVAYYVEGNPNPFNLENYANNHGLSENELDKYIGGDMFNILIECQEQDRKEYVLNLAFICVILSLIQFFGVILW